jgi:hypothetical protein
MHPGIMEDFMQFYMKQTFSGVPVERLLLECLVVYIKHMTQIDSIH